MFTYFTYSDSNIVIYSSQGQGNKHFYFYQFKVKKI